MAPTQTPAKASSSTEPLGRRVYPPALPLRRESHDSGQEHQNATADEPISASLSGDKGAPKKFNVHAASFVVPQAKQINQAPGVVFETPPADETDFAPYTNRGLLADLLPVLPSSDPAYCYQTVSRDKPALRPGTYERFFRLHQEEEVMAQQMENDACSLFEHDGVVEFAQGLQVGEKDRAMVTIVVPGLREEKPLVETGDVVQLRQLRQVRFDSSRRLLLHHPDRHGHPPWTGIIYNARVSAVLRTDETLVLSVVGLNIALSEGLLHLSPFDAVPKLPRLTFNVQFPVAAHRYRPMSDVLPMIQASLKRASDMTTQAQRMDDAEPSDWTSTYWVQSMLFPTEADCDVQANVEAGIDPNVHFDGNLNQKERAAVTNVCTQNYGVLPYLISGPPGSGKTKTLVEVALQLVSRVAEVNHILMCSPSEQAADTLADRLRVFASPGEMLRLNRPSRSPDEVPEGLLPYCFTTGNSFGLPPVEQLMTYKIVVTSCRDASMLLYARLANSDLYAVEYGLRRRLHPLEPTPYPNQRLHWDALLVDEASQATEPETLIPLRVVSPPADSANLVSTLLVAMAGDEHQRSPRTASAHSPLQRSLFARLLARPVYANHPLARAFHTHLAGNSTE
ncbi:P-loop containing nucleoside triphosphate hydrolase protein [Parachaetomium inaequale]|uniref:P-loop containing nucleoside triphosphate hydrolase protein n=1 Tax=Parachaetomium inaequale TaxID=2588326 RepID=A0AAN6PEJ7_9PEZI|nr:P-loop containing nucleoside triphosphate hydrolase protein [Parachaetomium inaequale]